VADSLKFKTKKGKIVYGGGGIIPDIFVPLEGKHGDEALTMIMQSGIVSYFVFEEVDKNRKEFEKLNAVQVEEKIRNTDYYFNGFRKHLSKSGLIFNLEKHQDVVKQYLAAEFVRQLFNEQKYYQIILKQDPMIKAVLSAKK